MKLRGTLFIKQIVQSYRPTETVWCNRFTQQNPKPKLVSVLLNRLWPKSAISQALTMTLHYLCVNLHCNPSLSFNDDYNVSTSTLVS